MVVVSGGAVVVVCWDWSESSPEHPTAPRASERGDRDGADPAQGDPTHQ